LHCGSLTVARGKKKPQNGRFAVDRSRRRNGRLPVSGSDILFQRILFLILYVVFRIDLSIIWQGFIVIRTFRHNYLR